MVAILQPDFSQCTGIPRGLLHVVVSAGASPDSWLSLALAMAVTYLTAQRKPCSFSARLEARFLSSALPEGKRLGLGHVDLCASWPPVACCEQWCTIRADTAPARAFGAALKAEVLNSLVVGSVRVLGLICYIFINSDL